MKRELEIDPEIRGLLEEIASDPRSALRLAPRHALRGWFERPEPARTRDLVTTSAERHLIEAYREEVAELLCEGARLAFCKAPMWMHPAVDSDGQVVDVTASEPTWRKHAACVCRSSSAEPTGKDLLIACLGAIDPRSGFAMARASLALIPRDRTRYFLALNAPWDSPHLALAILACLRGRAPFELDPHAARLEAARLCTTGRLARARTIYVELVRATGPSAIDLCYALNLACASGDPALALGDAEALNRSCSTSDPDLREAKYLVGKWLLTRSPEDRATSLRTASRVGPRIGGPAEAFLEVFQA
ncbi:MAG TPA: hypothetical protein VF530_18305 [Planctomycetota bacterium]